MVAIKSPPSTLRRLATCTERLASSTTSPGHTCSSSSLLVSTWPGRATIASSRSKARLPRAAGAPSTSRRRSCGCSSKRPKRRLGMDIGLLFDFFEIDPLVDRQILQVPAQAIETHLHRTEPHPVAPADNAGAAQDGFVRSRDREADGAGKLDAIGALVD